MILKKKISDEEYIVGRVMQANRETINSEEWVQTSGLEN